MDGSTCGFVGIPVIFNGSKSSDDGIIDLYQWDFGLTSDIDEKVAAQCACRMEHVLSPETLERLVRLVEFMRAHRRSDDVTLGRLLDCLNTGKCLETGSGKPRRSRR